MICVKGYIGKWSSSDERQKWEKDFSATLIDPVIADIETVLRNTYTLAMKGTYIIIHIFIVQL